MKVTTILLAAIVALPVTGHAGQEKAAGYKWNKHPTVNISPRSSYTRVYIPRKLPSVMGNSSKGYKWGRSMAIKAPGNSGGRGGPCHKCPAPK